MVQDGSRVHLAVALLLGEVVAERSISDTFALGALFCLVGLIVVQVALRFEFGLGLRVVHTGVLVDAWSANTDVLSLDVEKSKLSHIVQQEMVDFDTFLRLVKSVFVSVNLGQNGTKLHE